MVSTMSKRLLRILRHRSFDDVDAKRCVGGDAGLARVEALIRDSEREHLGEIRVCVEGGLPLSYLWGRATARERAVAMFGKLGVWDTEHNTGVLIYLLLAERRIEIVADRGLRHSVSSTQWQALADEMSAAFKSGAFETGLAAAVTAVGHLLHTQAPLPASGANADELPNRVVVR
jgi:hypothetical protein